MIPEAGKPGFHADFGQTVATDLSIDNKTPLAPFDDGPGKRPLEAGAAVMRLHVVGKPGKTLEARRIEIPSDPEKQPQQRPQPYLPRSRKKRRFIDCANGHLIDFDRRRNQAAGDGVDRFGCLRQASGGCRKPGRVDPVGGKQRHDPAKTGACEAWIRVHRVLDGHKSGDSDRLGQPGSRNIEERPENRHLAGTDFRSHGRKAEQSRPPRQPQQKRFSLIVPVMAEKKMAGADLARRTEEKAIAGGPGRRLDVALGLFTRPAENFGVNSAAPGKFGNPGGILPRRFTKPVINRQNEK